jgi:hypothetical protein
MHAFGTLSTSRLQIGEPLSLRLRLEELSLLRPRIEKPPLSRHWGAVVALPSNQGAIVAAAPNRRAATITHSDREVAAARLRIWDRPSVARPEAVAASCSRGTVVVVHRGGASKTKP